MANDWRECAASSCACRNLLAPRRDLVRYRFVTKVQEVWCFVILKGGDAGDSDRRGSLTFVSERAAMLLWLVSMWTGACRVWNRGRILTKVRSPRSR